MRLLDLFSGIGGFSLAASWAGIKTVQFVEYDKYCQKVLDKNFKGVAIHGDIKTYKGVRGSADVITGGFPCQPFSVAGNRRGAEDYRALWPEMFRIIKEVRPAWVIGENVAGIVNMELDNVLLDLESEGYETQPFVIPACAVDAKHRRDRVWILGSHAKHNRSTEQKCQHQRPKKLNRSCSNGLDARKVLANSEKSKRTMRESKNLCQADGRPRGSLQGESVSASNVAYSDTRQRDRKEKEVRTRGDAFNISGQNVSKSNGDRLQRKWKKSNNARPFRLCDRKAGREPSIWPTEPNVGRVAHGVSRRVDRLKGLGNAIVPQVAYEIFKAIREDENE